MSKFYARYFCTFFLLLFVASAHGQISADTSSEELQRDDAAPETDANGSAPEISWKLARGAKEFGFEAGFSPIQPTFFSGHKEYDTNGRKFVLASVRYGRVIGTAKGVTYEYLFEFSPLSLAIKNEVRDRGRSLSNAEDPKHRSTVRRNTYGVAVMPAGFRFVFLPERRLKPYAQAGAGFLFSRKPIPTPASPSYNFAGDFGGGIMYSLSRRRTVQVGYRYFHLSNMNIGEVNPGYNANTFYIGFSFFSK